MNYYFDTEFLDDGKTIDLISIGLLSEDMHCRPLYMINSEFDESKATDWLKEHVLNHIPRQARRHTRAEIAAAVAEYVQPVKGNRIWGWYPAYDWVVLCQLYGPMVARPPHFPKRPDDLKQVTCMFPKAPLPSQKGTKHNAVEDARWVRDAHDALLRWVGDKAILEVTKNIGFEA